MRIRWHLAGLVILSMLAGGGVGRAQTLRQAAQRIGLLVGTAVRPELFSNPQYAGTLARQFNMVEAENSMKWTATEPAEGKFNFGPGDKIVAFAEAHGMKVRGHNLLWDKDNPGWLTRGHFTPQELRHIMKRHILTVARHYRGKVFAWDAVNEAFDGDGRLSHSIWYDQPGIGLAGKGTAYVAQAFRWAHQADPYALLFYNDYAAAGMNAKSNAIYAMVKKFKQEGVPINGVGLQLHIFSSSPMPVHLAENIRRLTKLGVEVQITEMDVALPLEAGGKVSAAELNREAKIYGKIARTCAEIAGCTALQTWGFTDRYSWIPWHTHGKRGAALLFDANYRPKPAYHAVIDAFEQALKSDSQIREKRTRFEQSAGER